MKSLKLSLLLAATMSAGAAPLLHAEKPAHGIQVIEGELSRSELRSPGAELEMRANDELVRLSVRNEILSDQCASDSDEVRLRAFGDYQGAAQTMTVFHLELRCGSEWVRVERWARPASGEVVAAVLR